jgi:hypothetical protein
MADKGCFTYIVAVEDEGAFHDLSETITVCDTREQALELKKQKNLEFARLWHTQLLADGQQPHIQYQVELRPDRHKRKRYADEQEFAPDPMGPKPPMVGSKLVSSKFVVWCIGIGRTFPSWSKAVEYLEAIKKVKAMPLISDEALLENFMTHEANNDWYKHAYLYKVKRIEAE